MVKDLSIDSVVEPEWQRVAHMKQNDREAALNRFFDWRIKIQQDGISDVSHLPLSKLTDRERSIVKCDATALADLIRKRTHTCVEVLIAFAKAAVVAQDFTNCLTEIFIEEALGRAQELDTYLDVNGTVVGPLHGQSPSISSNSA
jgi:amidase